MSQTQLAAASTGGHSVGGLVPGGAPAALGEPQQYLVFSLCGEAFAIGIRSIKEIIEYGQLTEVPMMPDLVRGVINLRGAVVPVVDLAVRFGRAPTEVARRTCIVIIEIESQPGEAQTIGVIVDAVTEVLDIPPQDIEPPPSFGARIRSDFIEGMGKVGGKFVILLDMGHALSIDELSDIVGSVDDAARSPAPQERVAS
jgi:purine-binding chemotaxis protein CheW